MTMRISGLIARLEAAKELYGDLPAYTTESDIKSLEIHPCRNGVERTTDGVPDEPNELVLDFIPCG